MRGIVLLSGSVIIALTAGSCTRTRMGPGAEAGTLDGLSLQRPDERRSLILDTGEVILVRPNADFVLKLKDGSRIETRFRQVSVADDVFHADLACLNGSSRPCTGLANTSQRALAKLPDPQPLNIPLNELDMIGVEAVNTPLFVAVPVMVTVLGLLIGGTLLVQSLF